MDSTVPVPGSPEDRDPSRLPAEEFPSVEEALRAVLSEYPGSDGTPYRISIGLFGNGEVTWKVFVKESDETEGGLISIR
jgi:hypothetical protein